MLNEELLSLILLRILQSLAVGCVFAAVFFLAWPRPWAQKTNYALSKWISTEKLTKKLDLAVHIDEQFLKMRKLLSFIALILALILVYLCFGY